MTSPRPSVPSMLRRRARWAERHRPRPSKLRRACRRCHGSGRGITGPTCGACGGKGAIPIPEDQADQYHECQSCGEATLIDEGSLCAGCARTLTCCEKCGEIVPKRRGARDLCRGCGGGPDPLDNWRDDDRG